jgi:hypothetical protein
MHGQEPSVLCTASRLYLGHNQAGVERPVRNGGDIPPLRIRPRGVMRGDSLHVYNTRCNTRKTKNSKQQNP